MKVLLLNDYATPTGGAEISLLTLRDGLRARGHDAWLLASTAGPGVNFADHRCFGTLSGWRTLLQTVNPAAAQAVRRARAEFRPDVVHVRMFLTQLSPSILPALRGVPALYHVAWYRPICPLGTKRLPDGSPCRVDWGRPCLANGCLPLPDWLLLMRQMRSWWRQRDAFAAVVVDSAHMQRQLTAAGLFVTDLIPPGTPETPARPPLADPPTIGFAGRLVREKGVDVLLAAFAQVVTRVPAARLVIIGDGPERPRLARQVAALRLGDRVTMPGQLSRDQTEQHLARAWVQVVPSVWAEPFGMVAAESLMRGTATVVSASGGLAEIVEHDRTGYQVPPGDPDALAAALVRLLSRPDLAEQFGRAGREQALARFGQHLFVQRFLDVYDRLLAAAAATGSARRP